MKHSSRITGVGCCVAALVLFCCGQISAQVITRPDETPVDVQTETITLPTGNGQPARPAVSDAIADKDDVPAKRNPFWTVGWQPDSSSSSTSSKGTRSGFDRPLETQVDWPDTTKYVQDAAKVSLMGTNIVVVFEGKTYDIGQVLQVTRKGYSYGLKLMDGATLAPQWVRPAGN